MAPAHHQAPTCSVILQHAMTCAPSTLRIVIMPQLRDRPVLVGPMSVFVSPETARDVLGMPIGFDDDLMDMDGFDGLALEITL